MSSSAIADRRLSGRETGIFEARGECSPCRPRTDRFSTSRVFRRRRRFPAGRPTGRARLLERPNRRVRAHCAAGRGSRRRTHAHAARARVPLPPVLVARQQDLAFIDQAMQIQMVDVGTDAGDRRRQGGLTVRGRAPRASRFAGRPTAVGSRERSHVEAGSTAIFLYDTNE